jgi:mannitol/fructose-specific phosphotransferase system IIA component (Ntr-type)
MSDSESDETPQPQPAPAGGPPRPPKKTARGLDEASPDDYFWPKVEVVELQAQDRWQAIEELVNHLVNTHKIQAAHRDSIVESLRKRELSMSTGIGSGIGVPHASTPWVSQMVAIAGRSRKGIEFEALDRQPVHCVYLFLVPAGPFQKKIPVLANLALFLDRRGFRHGLSDGT